MRRALLPLLVLALLVGTTAAFAVTEALKLEPSTVSRPRFDRVFSPTCDCAKASARLSLRLRKEETVDAVVIDAAGDPVRTLASNSREAPGRLTLRWDGEDDAGILVPDGAYRLRVRLQDERRTIVIPNVVRVDTEPPVIELVELSPRVLSPDGDGRGDRAAIEARLSERARPLVFVDGELAARGPARAAGTVRLLWPGTSRGRPLPAGSYAVDLRARDGAGNVSLPDETAAVRIRFVELAGRTLRARRGGTLRFRVSTDAATYEWALLRRSAGRRPLLEGTAATETVALRLPRRIRPGRYVLRVVANGRDDAAPVVVRRRR